MKLTNRSLFFMPVFLSQWNQKTSLLLHKPTTAQVTCQAVPHRRVKPVVTALQSLTGMEGRD